MNIEYKTSEFNLTIMGDDSNFIYYNTFSGSLIVLEKEINFYLKTRGSEFEKLIELGFFVPEKQDEINKFIIERKKVEFGQAKKLARFVVAPTMACQAKCVYCFQSGIQRNNYMSQETARAVVDFIICETEKTNAQEVIVTFFGGEPLLEKDRIIEIGQSLKAHYESKNIKYKTELITNGILLSKELVQELKIKTNFHYAQITLDGTRDVYARVKGIDKYDQVVSNIKDICDDIKIIIRLNITKENQDNIKDLLHELLTKNGLDNKIKISLARVQDYFGCDFNDSSCMTPSEFGEYRAALFENKNKQYKSLKKQDLLPAIRRCFCGMENCMSSTIGPQGELYKCEHYFGVETEVIGTVWEGRYYNNAEMCFYSDLDKKCIKRRCALLPTCVGGCQSERVQYGVPTDCEEKKQQFCREILAYVRNN